MNQEGTCSNCGIESTSMRLGRCSACYSYHYRTGRERPVPDTEPRMSDRQVKLLRARVDKEAKWKVAVAFVWMANEAVGRMR